MNITLHPQECSTHSKFDSQMYMTAGFKERFGDMAGLVATLALVKIKQERVLSDAGADYLQVAEYMGIKFWIIDDGMYITALLPEEY